MDVGRVGVGVVVRGALAEPPAEGAGGTDEDDGDAVEEDRLRGRGRDQMVGGGRVGGCRRGEERRGRREVRAVDAGQVVAEGGGGTCAVLVVGHCAVVGVAVGVAVSSGEEGFVFGGVVVVVEGLGWCVGEGEAAVVEALTEQDDVGERVVDGEDNHGRENALEHGSEDVEHIAGKPDDDEEEGEAVGRTAPEVFDDLRGEYDDPASD